MSWVARKLSSIFASVRAAALADESTESTFKTPHAYGGTDRESPCVAERHVSSASILFQGGRDSRAGQRKIPSFAPLSQSILNRRPFSVAIFAVKMTYKVVVLRVELRFVGRVVSLFVVDIPDSGIRHLGQSVGYSKPFEMHAGRMSLNHSGVAIYVNHQSRRKSPLSMNKAKTIIVRPDEAEVLRSRNADSSLILKKSSGSGESPN